MCENESLIMQIMYLLVRNLFTGYCQNLWNLIVSHYKEWCIIQRNVKHLHWTLSIIDPQSRVRRLGGLLPNNISIQRVSEHCKE